MEPADRAVIRRYVGTGFNEGDADEALDRLGSAHAAALDLLMVRLSTLSGLATDVAAGGRRSNHDKTIEATRRQIAALVAASSGLTGLGPEAEDLFAEAAGDVAVGTMPITLVTPNRRRAG